MKLPSKQYPESKKIILRDFLAIDRTRLANQRTLLSFLRTSLYLVVSALAILKVESLKNLISWSWVGLALAGLVATMGIINYLLVNRRIKAAYKMNEQEESSLN